MSDLRRHGRRQVAERFELVVHRKAHGDGGLQSPWDKAGKHKVERADLASDLSRERHPFGGKVRALAACGAFLCVRVTSNLDRAHRFNT
jgi:hypothetical protein